MLDETSIDYRCNEPNRGGNRKVYRWYYLPAHCVSTVDKSLTDR